MGEKALVEDYISDAATLIEELDGRDVAPSFAAWFFYEDAEKWQLLIAGPHFDELLPKKESLAYHTLAEAMRNSDLSSISIADVKLVRTDSKLPQAVGWMISTPSTGLARVHLTDNYVNGIFLKEVYVLRSAAEQLEPGGGTWSVGHLTA